jgi:hypothetical protein
MDAVAFVFEKVSGSKPGKLHLMFGIGKLKYNLRIDSDSRRRTFGGI